MAVHLSIPKFRQLPKVAAEYAPDFGEKSWEFDVPTHSNIYFSIILAYLMPHATEDNTPFQTLLASLVDEEVSGKTEIEQCIFHYNPFQNRHAIFYKAEFKTLIKQFETCLRNFIFANDYRPLFRHLTAKKKSNFTADVVLQAASLKLRYLIVVITKSDVEVYPKCHLDKNFDKTIVLFAHKGTEENEDDYMKIYWPRVTYCLPYDVAQNLFTSAVRNVFRQGILKKSDEDGILELEHLCLLDESTENFLTTLLVNGKADVLKKLLMHPDYLLFKLSECCLGIDPTVPDKDENSTFYHAAVTGDVHLLFMLYMYFVNSSDSFREPTSGVVERTMRLKTVLMQVAQMAQVKLSEGKEKNRILGLVNELSCLRDCEEDLYGKILRINQNIDYFREHDNISDAEKCKSTLLTILSIYNKYFHMVSNSSTDEEFALYETFRSNQNFFQHLDYQIALYFFDHSFSVKEKLQIKDGAYEFVESSFARYIFASGYYRDNARLFTTFSEFKSSETKSNPYKSTFKPHRMTRTEIQSLVFVYLERMRLQRRMTKFKELLEATVVNKDKCVPCLPSSEVYTLESEPVIKDEMVLFRLKHYLELALTMDLSQDSDMGPLVIQRCIQVIGESIHMEEEEKPTIITSLLESCLSMNEKSDFIDTRNNFCHFNKDCCTIERMQIEKDREFAKKLKNGIETVQDSLQHVFCLHEIMKKQFFISEALKVVTQWVNDLKISHKNRETKIVSYNRLFSSDGTSADDPAGMQSAKGERQSDNTERRFKKTIKEFKKLKWILQKRHGEAQKELLEKSMSLHQQYEQHLRNHFTWMMCKELSIISDVNPLNVTKKEMTTEVIEPIVDRNDGECFEEQKNKIKIRLQNHITSVECLLQFIISSSPHRSKVKRKMLSLVENYCNRSITDEGISPDATSCKENCNKLKTVAQEVWKKIFGKVIYFDTPAPGTFSNIHLHKFRMILRGHCFLSEEEKEYIKSNVRFKKHHEALIELMTALEADVRVHVPLSEERKNELLGDLLLSNQRSKQFQSCYNSGDIEGAKSAVADNYADLLVRCLEDNAMPGKEFNRLCNKFKFEDSEKTLLEKIIMGRPKKYQKKPLEFFYDRLIKMKTFLVTSDPSINRLWQFARSEPTRRFMQEKMVRKYMRQPVVQAAIEQLIFDCMVVLKKKGTNLKHLWHKTKYLFNGINLRHVLAHGNPLFQGIGSGLDPCDLPQEIISKVIELMADETAIRSMVFLTQHLNIDREGFVKLAKLNDHKEYEDYWRAVKECPKWEEYAKLIPKFIN